MDGHKPDALTDPLDREIDTLMAVDPSPEFLARVRTRVAAETPQVSWFRWEFAAMAASVGVAVVVTAMIWPSREPAGQSSERVQTPQVVEQVFERPAPRESASAEPERVVPSQAAVEPASWRPEADDLLVVAPEDARAFDRLLASIREPDVVLVLNEDRSGLMPIGAPALAIAPIVIEPVPDVAPLEGGVE
jgi:hypothetical protein